MINQAIRCKYKHIARAIGALPIFLTLGMQSLVQAQSIVPSNGMGTIVSPNGDIRGGQTAGSNQFHTFDQFNLNAGERANFITDENIQNVLGRVIGGEPSSINGLIQLTGSNANLYLINPTGIIIGPDAQLDVPSSFFATTADHLRFGENLLDVYDSIDFSELTGDPTGFIFTSDRVGAIVNLGELRVLDGDLALLGGTVISTGSLSAPEGRVIITAVEGGNEINISQSGSLLTLSIQRTDILNNFDENIVPVISLPELLTGSAFSDEASELVVKEDGSVWLTSSSDETEASEIELGRDGILYVDNIFSSGRPAFLLYRDLIDARFRTEFRRDVANEEWYAEFGADPRVILSVQDVSNSSLRLFKDLKLISLMYSEYNSEFMEGASTGLTIPWRNPWAGRDPSPIEGVAPLPISEAEQNIQNVPPVISNPIESLTVDEIPDSRIEIESSPTFPVSQTEVNSPDDSESFDPIESSTVNGTFDSRIEMESSPTFSILQTEVDSSDGSGLFETSRVLNSISELGSRSGLNIQSIIMPSNFRFASEIDADAFLIERAPRYRDSDVLLPSPSLDNLLIFSSQGNSS